LHEAIYIQGDVCPSLHRAVGKKIKTPKGGRKKYSLKNFGLQRWLAAVFKSVFFLCEGFSHFTSI